MHEEVTIPELTEVVARLAALLGPREGAVVQLEGGITNRNFRVNFGGTDYVRAPPRQEDQRCSASTARRSASPPRRAAELGIAPPVAAMHRGPALPRHRASSQGASSTRRGAPTSPSARSRWRPRPARLPRLRHRAARPSFDSVRAGRGLRAHRERSTAIEPPAELRGGRARAPRRSARRSRSTRSTRPSPCHNDLLTRQLPPRRRATCSIIDWEYAGMGDRYFDLGNFAVNNELGRARTRSCCSADYFGEPPDARRRATLAAVPLHVGPARGDVGRRPDARLGARLRLRRATPRKHFARLDRDRAPTPASTTWLAGGPVLSGPASCRAPRAACHRRRRRRDVDRVPPRRTLGWDDVVLVERNQLTSGSTFHSAGLVGQLRGSVSLTKMMMYSVELYRRLGASRVRPRLDRVRQPPAGVERGAHGGAPPPGGLGEDVRPAARADLGRRGAGALPADVHRRRARRGLAPHRRLPRPVAAHLRARRRRPRRRRDDPHVHARDRHRRPSAGAGHARAHRTRRHRGRHRGDRRRHVRRRGRPARGRAHPGRADVARVPRHPAVPRARPARTRCRRCATPTCSSTSARRAAGS